MTPRESLLIQFLERAGWGDARRTLLAGDASNRRYDRVVHPVKGRAILMDAPPEKDEDTRPFIAIAKHLSARGFSAPKIYADDIVHGFLLLEDLGDDLFARVLERDPAPEQLLYEAATDVLVDLHQHAPPEGLPSYSPNLMAQLAALPFDWYLMGTDQPATLDEKETFQAEIETLLNKYAGSDDVLIQRDYHAENLLWLPERDGSARVGLLDFQDALCGHRAYDLVSVLEDARRDVPRDLAEKMIDRYVAATGCDADAFRAAYAVLGAQRNLRILGVFARLCIRDGKAHYVDLIPRVWDHLMHDLRHPVLAGLSARVEKLPNPTPAVLERIKSKCAPKP